jgi:hypothetical protein
VETTWSIKAILVSAPDGMNGLTNQKYHTKAIFITVKHVNNLITQLTETIKYTKDALANRANGKELRMDGEITQSAKEVAYILAQHYHDNDMLIYIDDDKDQVELWISGERVNDNTRVTLRWRKDAQDEHKTG